MKLLALAFALVAAPAVAHNGVAHDPQLPAATKAQIHQVADAVARYRDFRVAEAEGWKKFGDDEPLMGEHWYLPGGPDYQGSDARIDWSRPSNLMYTTIDGKRVLTGVSFNVRLAPGERLPEGFAGNSDHWHVHDFERAIEAALTDRPILKWLANGWIDENYRSKGDNRGRVAMVHAWVTLPNPDGIFADTNRTVPYLKLGLPAAWANGASEHAARGLDMATAGGCRALIDGRAWIANLSRTVTRQLHAECATGASDVRAALPRRAAATNRAGADAHRRFETLWQRLLTPAQHQRIGAMGEHDADAHATRAHAAGHHH